VPPSIQFAFVVHNHQPIGNLDWVIGQACEQAYLPFLEALQRHPGVTVGLHQTGPLLKWMDERRPDIFDLVRALADAGQVEIVTGAMYEPILPVIPQRDQVGQIRQMTGYLEQRFGQSPRGGWLAERIWEPSLPGALAEAGIVYTLLDQRHFQAAGTADENSLGYFITEDQGATVAVFPINETLRCGIPFEPPEKSIDYLRSLATDGGDRLAVFADDGEKFGDWPGTHDWVYGQGWLEQFFSLVEANGDWLRPTTLGAYLDSHPPQGRIYLPCASYPEMEKWSGGFWRHFLARYSEANVMHKKMLWVSDLVARAFPESGRSVDAEAAASARDDLWRGQCNCPYWHGVFGGLYLPHLRAANYRHLLRAERTAIAALPARRSPPAVAHLDLDADGREEAMLRSAHLGLVVHSVGGAIMLLEDYRRDWNLQATLARRPERYHEEMRAKAAEKGEPLDEFRYDWHPRWSALDHFFGAGTTLEAMADARWLEQGDFVTGSYGWKRVSGRDAGVILHRDGHVWVGDWWAPVALEKEIRLARDRAAAAVSLRVANLGDRDAELWLGSEWNLALSGPRGEGRGYHVAGAAAGLDLDARAEHQRLDDLALVDPWLGLSVRFQFGQPTDVWTFPVETVSQGVETIDKIFQHSAVILHWGISVGPGESWETDFTLTLEALQS